MTKTKRKPVPSPAPAPPKPAESVPTLSGTERTRETIESVVIAFVLAFLFRTFEAEAFVIPTGSMAPTLMGRHKDIACPQCDYRFQVSASDEVDESTNVRHAVLTAGVCPLCQYIVSFDPDDPAGRERLSYKGDRILVGKFAYEFGDPERWDVSVFKFPGSAKTNYIKRIIGLPRETIRIRHGDVSVRDEQGQGFAIARKPPDKIQAMLQVVYDNDYQLKALSEAGWPARWQATPGDVASLAANGWPRQPLWPDHYEAPQEGWQSDDGHRSFSISAAAQGENWLRYRHIVPPTWTDVSDVAHAVRSEMARPQLITDSYAYNAFSSRSLRSSATERSLSSTQGMHWVGDLALDCELTSASDEGEAVFELIEGGQRFQCHFVLSTGEATLWAGGQELARAATKVRGEGSHEICFANVDDQLLLWVDGDLVQFDRPTTYDSESLGTAMPKAIDLSPAGIASRGAALRVEHLKLRRDIYYIALKYPTHSFSEFDRPPDLTSPDRWQEDFRLRPSEDFALEEDQFLVLGDNSPRSADSRLWAGGHHVARELLIGKALYIYWPHGWETLGNTPIPTFQFWPNFRRMGFIR
jgi:signal peptidase I